MGIRKNINGMMVFTMRDISEKLEIKKYHIKNWIREFDLQPNFIENRIWYFNIKGLLPFLTYLINKEKLTNLKNELKEWKSKKISLKIY